MSRGRLATVLVLGLFLAACGGSAEVVVEDAWSRPVPPVSPASAVYLTIDNGLEDDITVTGASSDACGMMELHETSMSNDGVMSMARLEVGLVVAAGGTAVLEPGGAHLMCMQPEGTESFEVTIQLDGADDITVPVQDGEYKDGKFKFKLELRPYYF